MKKSNKIIIGAVILTVVAGGIFASITISNHNKQAYETSKKEYNRVIPTPLENYWMWESIKESKDK